MRAPRAAAVLGSTALAVVTGGCASPCNFCRVDDDKQTYWPAGAHAPQPSPGKHVVEVIATERVVPGVGLPENPEGHEALASNNNLDVVRFEGRVLLAFRTAPTHFASADARIHVVSSADEQTWTLDATFAVGRDLREPRFLALGDRLFLYVTELGKDRAAFEPGKVKYTTRRADSGWAPALTTLFDDGRLLWRTATYGGKGWATWYHGGQEIYRPIQLLAEDPFQAILDGISDRPLETGLVRVTLASTTDGVSFAEVAPEMHVGGASETAFVFTEDGGAYAVMRTELPEAPGGAAGSNVCRGSHDKKSWSCKRDPRKFDSPFMFEHDGEVYLLARRNLAQDGLYAEAPVRSWAEYVRVQQRYSCARKRCSLWRIVKGEDRVEYVTDLPSRGDTCFPSVLSGPSPDEVVVYDYSAPLNDTTEQRWCEAQDDKTHIYRHVLRFSKNDGTRPQPGAYQPPAGEPSCDD